VGRRVRCSRAAASQSAAGAQAGPTCGAAVPRIVTIDAGSSSSCLNWLANVPAMKLPKKTVMTWKMKKRLSRPRSIWEADTMPAQWFMPLIMAGSNAMKILRASEGKIAVTRELMTGIVLIKSTRELVDIRACTAVTGIM